MVGGRETGLRPDVLIGVALGVAVVLVYAPVIGFDFINFDDRDYVTENPHVTAGLSWAGLRWALTGVHASNWFPLTWLSHMLDWQLFGPNAGGHHVTSVLLHAGSSVLLFLGLRLMTGAVWPSAFVAALFALHPLRVESVAWVAERKDVLSVFFFTLGLWCYGRCVTRPSFGRQLALVLTLVLGLMSKGMVVTLPFVCLLLDWWPLGRVALPWAPAGSVPGRLPREPPRRLVLEKLPLFVLAALGSAVTIAVQRTHGAGVVLDHPLAVRVATALASYVRYIATTIWPTRLAVFYPLHGAPSLGELLVVGLILGGISVLAVWNARGRPYLIVGWLWYLATLAPTIDLVRYGGRDFADRYTYLPSIGLLVMVAWGVPELLRRSPARHVACGLAAAAVLASASILTRAQLEHWRNSAALFEHALAVTERNHLAHYNLGVDLAERGRRDDAIAHYAEAVRIKPDYALAQGNLGTLLAERGQLDEAIGHFQAALEVRPSFAEAHNNLAMTLERVGRTREATAHYAEAVRLRPDRPDGHFNLAAALSGEGRHAEAIAELREAIRLQPGFDEARFALAATLAEQGRAAEATEAYRDLLRVRPESPAARERLAWSLATADDPAVRDPALAVSLAEEACRMTGRQDPDLLRTLAVAYAAAGRREDGEDAAEEALVLARALGRAELAAELAARLGNATPNHPDP